MPCVQASLPTSCSSSAVRAPLPACSFTLRVYVRFAYLAFGVADVRGAAWRSSWAVACSMWQRGETDAVCLSVQIYQIYEGTSQIQRLIVSRHMYTSPELLVP